ncbi:phytoene desaturase [Novosphingobium sp. B 225]|uniref:phytoene desaturase n=1 Tax=Novosphingobium sp. B 225 TaxID=1961849 RepID=UPI000B4C2018|nr:phytoene desaturase [Novosphingobium sp. B 225]
MSMIPPLAPRRACVIGAGFGGLALAIRLQASGVETVLVEARDKVGGRAYGIERDGFTFDTGPTLFTDPAALSELWSLSGHDMAADIELMPVNPFWRLNWPDGAQFDLTGDEASLTREVARVAPGDLGGLDDFLHYSAAALAEGYRRLGSVPFPDFRAAVRALPALLRQQTWRSLWSIASSQVKDDHLRQALTFQALLIGASPLSTSAVQALAVKLEQDTGVWWPRGGAGQLADAMAKHFARLGGTLRLHDPVVHLHTLGNRATEVETQSGWKERFDAVASNADVMHTYRELLSGTQRGSEMARSLARKRYSPGVFLVHFALEGSWPGIQHHTMLFGPRYKGLLEDVFDHGVLPQDQMILLDHPTVTDPSMAPPGKSVFRAMVPVAHLGKLPIDWDTIGPMLEKRVIDEVGRRLIPDIHDRIVTRFHYAPRDFALDFNAYLGSGWGLEPVLSQTAWLRPHSRDSKIANLYLVGAGAHPGAGVPAVLGSARAAAKLMLEDIK